MSDQPKPAGEWTPEYVRSIAIAPDQYTRIADAHNAALESAKQDFAKQIAAERERGKQADVQLDHHDGVIKTLREQLAASRQREREADEDALRQVDALRDQLAAEREKVQTFVDALTKLLRLNEAGLANTAEAKEVISATLEKVK